MLCICTLICMHTYIYVRTNKYVYIPARVQNIKEDFILRALDTRV